MDELNNASDFGEYVTFTITAKDGTEVEMAVVDEFEFEKKNYIVEAMVKDDMVDDNGQYIYRCHITEDGFKAEKISNALDYERIAKAYMEMED